MDLRRILRAASIAGLCLSPATSVSAQSVPLAQLTFPVDGVVLTAISQPFQWQAVPNAQAYYLYVGTLPGTKDVIDSGETQQTTFPSLNLPANCTLFVRLWTKASGAWRYVDSSFSVASLTATLTTPANGAAGLGLLQSMQWTSVPGAQAYVLWVGTTAGGKDLLATPETLQTSYGSIRLPAGLTLFTRMWTKVGGVWRYADSQFTTAPIASLTTPAAGASNVPIGQTFNWTSIGAAEAYYLYVGTAIGARDVVDTGEQQATSYRRPLLLPAARTLYARLWTKAAGIWRFDDATFATQPTASLATPTDGSTNVPLGQTFAWAGVEDAQAYSLFVGTSPGANDVINSGETAATSYQAPGPLPTATTLYARLWTKWGDTWRAIDSVFTTSPVARLTAPVSGSTNASPSQTFTWAQVPTAQAYVLYVGTSSGASDLVKTLELQQTFYQAANLPASQTLYARLWTKAGGTWRYIDSTFSVAIQTAAITAPTAGATDVSPLDAVRWTGVPSADAYVLWIGTSAGSHNVVTTPEIEDTSYVPMSLPAHQTLYARLWTSVGGVWRYSETTFGARSLTAMLVNPADGDTFVDPSVPAQWTRVADADAHVLAIGSAPGASDLLVSPETPQTSYPISTLRPGRVYARLWTRVGGQWRFVDSSFTVAPRAPEFQYPHDGAIAVDVSQPFRWTAALHAEAYELLIGTSAGAADVLDSGELATTSYLASGLAQGGALYARLWVKIGGSWSLHTDIRFTLDSQIAVATIVAPINRTLTFDTVEPFQWSAVPLASRYRLLIGTARGRYDLHDSGPIHVTRRFVPGLPTGVKLYGRLRTEVNHQWYSTYFTFTVAANSTPIDTRIATALWATDLVRRMAGYDAQPYPWTPLAQRLTPTTDYVLCTDYALTLVQILGETNLGLTAQRRDIAFNTKPFEGHSLVNLFNPDTGKWMLLDPTFDLAVKRSDGSWATAEDVSAAVTAFNWSAITYQFLGAAEDFVAKNYYVDYPLLYLNVAQPLVWGEGNSPLPYMTEVSVPGTGQQQLFVVRCVASASVDVVINGAPMSVSCSEIDGLSQAFSARTVEPPADSTTPFRLYTLQRFVF